MTDLQLRIFDFIRDRIERTGLAPTYDEISAHIRTKSRGGAHGHVQAIIAEGLLQKTGSGTRNLKLPGVALVAVPTSALKAELDRRNG